MPDMQPATATKTPEGQRAIRVLSIAPTSFFSDYGCHVRILEEARALKGLGYDVTILTYYKGSDVPGFRIVRTAPTPWHRNYEVGSSRHKFAFDLLLGIRLTRVLARNRFDIIHAHLHEGALLGSVLAKPWRVPVCFDYQGSLTSEMLDHGFLRRDTRLLGFWQSAERLIERLPNAIFTSTSNAAENLRQRLPVGTCVQALPDGVNGEVFNPAVLAPDERAAHRFRLGLPSDVPIVVFLGLLAAHQGIRCIIEAAARLKAQGRQVRWLVMGYPGAGDWQAQAVQCGVGNEVIFTGRVPYENAPRMLALGDIAIAPKLSRTEGSGKILNYMAMALPTVAFETPAQTEYLGNLGVYAGMGDVDGMAQRVAELIDHPDRRVELGTRLRSRARQLFGWDRTGAQIDAVYRALIPLPAAQSVMMRPGAKTPHG
jgi:glycosyltransferase involved in cell wall biosynthesis